MAKITIDELYRGDKYDIMSAVTAKALKLGIDERTEDGRTWIEMEFVRQTLIATEKMKKNGDRISKKELGDTVTFNLSDKNHISIEINDEDFGAVLICALRYCLGRRTYMPGLIIGYVTPLLPHVSNKCLRCIETDLSKPDLYGGFGDVRIDEPIWIEFRNRVREELEKRKEHLNENY